MRILFNLSENKRGQKNVIRKKSNTIHPPLFLYKYRNIRIKYGSARKRVKWEHKFFGFDYKTKQQQRQPKYDDTIFPFSITIQRHKNVSGKRQHAAIIISTIISFCEYFSKKKNRIIGSSKNALGN